MADSLRASLEELVHRADLDALDIAHLITRYSYQRGEKVYLEEDCDASRFMNAFRARFGHDPKLRDRIARERQSKVREYFCYTPAIAQNLQNN